MHENLLNSESPSTKVSRGESCISNLWKVFSFEDIGLEKQFVREVYQTKCYFYTATAFGIITFFLYIPFGATLMVAFSETSLQEYYNSLWTWWFVLPCSLLSVLSGILMTIMPWVPVVRRRGWTVVGLSAAIFFIGYLYFQSLDVWMLPINLFSPSAPTDISKQFICPSLISSTLGGDMFQDHGIGFPEASHNRSSTEFWQCATVHQELVARNILFLMASPQLLHLFGLQSKYHVPVLVIHMLLVTVYVVTSLNMSYLDADNFKKPSVYAVILVLYQLFFCLAALGGMVYPTINMEHASRRNFLRRENWSLFRRQLLREVVTLTLTLTLILLLILTSPLAVTVT